MGKKEILEHEIKNIVENVREEKIAGINVTVPYKQQIIPFLDKLSKLSEKTNSVNTVYKKNNEVIGDNTDVFGFVNSIKYQSINLKK